MPAEEVPATRSGLNVGETREEVRGEVLEPKSVVWEVEGFGGVFVPAA